MEFIFIGDNGHGTQSYSSKLESLALSFSPFDLVVVVELGLSHPPYVWQGCGDIIFIQVSFCPFVPLLISCTSAFASLALAFTSFSFLLGKSCD